MAGDFTKNVLDKVRQIPRGMVSTYGDIAFAVGRPKASRLVGYALHRNDEPVETPCHRVVFKDGRLCSGYIFGGEERQLELLQGEGVVFLPDGRVDMGKCRFFAF